MVAVGAAAAGGGLDGLAIGSDVAVSLGGGNVGVSEGGRVSVGDSEVGLGLETVGEAVGDGVGAKLGWRVEVLVGKASAIRVLVGVGVTAGALSRHWTANNPAKLAQTSRIEGNRCFTIDDFYNRQRLFCLTARIVLDNHQTRKTAGLPCPLKRRTKGGHHDQSTDHETPPNMSTTELTARMCSTWVI